MKHPLNPMVGLNGTSDIVLGKNKTIDALYGCFRLNNPQGTAFATERDVEIIANSGPKIRVLVPKSYKVDLPAGSKLVNTQHFRIEKIGKDQHSMALLTLRAGWNQVERDIKRMIDLDPNGTFIGKLRCRGGDIPLATASVLPLGRNNTWIGMILVHPEARRQGIANAMMQACVRHAIASGKIINGLDATPMGNTVYGAVGYVNSYRIWRSIFRLDEFANCVYDTRRIAVIHKKDLGAVARYDAAAFLERESILRRLFVDAQGSCFVYRNESDVICGYCLARPGRLRPFVGPFIADTEDIARNLMRAIARHLWSATPNGSAFIDTPECKFNNPGVYIERAFDQVKKPSDHRLSKTLQAVRDFTRMYQLVRDTDVARLVEQFRDSEGLSRHSPRVREFQATMAKSVENYTITRGFMELERSQLQHKYWGITGPEKG